jgi:hypothetical protein
MNATFSDSSSDESSIIDESELSGDTFMVLCAISIALSEQEVKCHHLWLAWDDHATILRHEKCELAFDPEVATLIGKEIGQSNGDILLTIFW